MPYDDENIIQVQAPIKASFNQIESSPSPRNAQGAMHPMIKKVQVRLVFKPVFTKSRRESQIKKS